MAAVETRRGIFITMLKNHFFNAFADVVFIIFAFKWLYNLDWGIILLFSITGFFYLTGIYSYSYYQAKVDLRDKGAYDFTAPLKIGGTSSLMILIPALLHILFLNVAPSIGEYFGVFARFWNYSFFWFIYGKDGTYFNWPALIIISLLPVATGYLSYYLGIRKFEFSEKIFKIIYKSNGEK